MEKYMMKNAAIFGLLFALAAGFSAVSNAQELLPELSEKLLGQFPRADRNGDGKLSGPEWAIVEKVILRRQPAADADGNGTLSQAEQAKLLKNLPGKPAANAPAANASPAQLAKFLKQYPESDADGDGKLSLKEAAAYRKALQNSKGKIAGKKGTFIPDPGWKEKRFPDHAVCYLTPEQMTQRFGDAFPNMPKSKDGSLRVVGTGHSFMKPGYTTLPSICAAAGLSQTLFTHTSGGMTGSTRYKWEQENGIFGFDKKPKPKLLPAIANAGWDVMLWGPYSQDQPEYYTCWIDFCLKYNPDMTFYLSDAWIRLWPYDGGKPPKDESHYTPEFLTALEAEKHKLFAAQLAPLRKQYPGKIFILPTSLAVTKAAVLQVNGELPGVESLHKMVTGKERSIWRDHRGHVGPGFDRLEGYVFYATLYKKTPELIETAIKFPGNQSFPSPELDALFRKIAWQAVTENPLSGVTDTNRDGIGD